MIITLGSSDIIIGATTCTSGCPVTVALYDYLKSSTATNLSTGITELDLGKGFIFADTVSIGTFTVPQAHFLQGLEIDSDVLAFPISGV
ncbi:hypothetical protein C8J57DRAFT_1512748 [Mycena rebaudengoi]|nr:hypothetical protein C8J57DRAFT_1512748 [Mycena rebaudengoi]